MSLSHSGIHHSFAMGGSSQKASADIAVPLEIEGQNFILEINDIQNIEFIDLDKPVSKKPQNILDQLNNSSSRDPVTGLS